MPTLRPDTLAVLERRIAPPDANGCRLWLGAKGIKGYGTVILDYRQIRVHRLVYELTTGPIPQGHDVHHDCGVRSCVTPEHLVALPHADHARLHVARNETVTHCRSGHCFDELNTYVTKRGIRQCRACNRERKRRAYRATRGLPPDLEVSCVLSPQPSHSPH